MRTVLTRTLQTGKLLNIKKTKHSVQYIINDLFIPLIKYAFL